MVDWWDVFPLGYCVQVHRGNGDFRWSPQVSGGCSFLCALFVKLMCVILGIAGGVCGAGPVCLGGRSPIIRCVNELVFKNCVLL